LDFINTANEKSFSFHANDFTEFLFTRTMNAGAGSKWMIASKLSVIPTSASATASATVSSSYLSSASQTFTWDLSDSDQAPYVGLQDTNSAPFGKDMFYIESEAPNMFSSAIKDGDSYVWINAGQKTCTTLAAKQWKYNDTTLPTTSAC
jgi:hypothetical protein